MGSKKFLLFASLLFSAWSCTTDIELFTENDEKPVVFALLDQSQTVQYFRINPTFVGEGDARTLAKDPNLTNYKPGEIEVRLIDLTSDRTYLAEETTEIKLDDDGVFGTDILMYKLETPVISEINPINGSSTITNEVIIADHEYKLLIRNNRTNLESYATATVGDINAFRLSTPATNVKRTLSSTYLRFRNEDDYRTYTFTFSTLNEASRYRLVMRYYYTEGTDTLLTEPMKYVEFLVGEVSDVDENATSVSIDFSGEKFYSTLKNNLEPNLARTGRKINLILTAAGKDLNTYINVHESTLTGISQERPEYSNVTNGLGIFSYRYTKAFSGFFLEEKSAHFVVDGEYTLGRFNCAYFGSIGDTTGAPYCP